MNTTNKIGGISKKKTKNRNKNDFQNNLMDKFLPLSITVCVWSGFCVWQAGLLTVEDILVISIYLNTSKVSDLINIF